MMAPTKNRMSPTAAAVPISGTLMPASSPKRARCLENAQHGHPRFRNARLGHGDADLLIADEIARGREDVSGGSEDSDNEVGGRRGELQ